MFYSSFKIIYSRFYIKKKQCRYCFKHVLNVNAGAEVSEIL